MNTTGTPPSPEIVPDFGYIGPKETKQECSNPQFHYKRYHKIGLFKKEHFGHPGDRDPCGLPGWVVKAVCVGCGREFKHSGFYPDATFGGSPE